MSLEPINKLIRYRKRLVKQVNYPMPSNLGKFEQEIWMRGLDAQQRELEALDAQITERTGGLVDPGRLDSEGR